MGGQTCRKIEFASPAALWLYSFKSIKARVVDLALPECNKTSAWKPITKALLRFLACQNPTMPLY